ncbi:HTH-type transcriptional regulator NsrR [Acetobacter nitrogenifigens DSM 23921 = NBRC 105050]|uniref:HTH-type transcriptional regulator NsrR n=2 Tax=Acetobacter nitrogenifigens TaxID=285268 RepID=A0A511X824_9PROT|nr:HTH-type transcriptional regulator NsrR [Acetobacter nitrogenifigens DSM 23921 = NBRC 105050]
MHTFIGGLGKDVNDGYLMAMKLTLHTDYALRVLIFLGCNTTRLASIREIADAYGISENHLVKVVHRLGQGGFIETVRGRGGGLRLGRSASDIVIGDVVRYTEDDLALLGCMNAEDPAACALMPACRLRGVLGEALSAFTTVLERYTLADIISPFERARLGDRPAGGGDH